MANEFDKTKPIHPFEWVGHTLSLLLTIVIIICLTSSSLYTVTVTDDLFDEMIGHSNGHGRAQFGVISSFTMAVLTEKWMANGL